MCLCSFRPFACAIVFIGILINAFGSSLNPQESKNNPTHNTFHWRDELHSTESLSQTFWEGVRGEKSVTKLRSPLDLNKFNGEHTENFIMFFASWCKSSAEAKSEFANVAQEITYTEGYDHVHFGAFDCSASLENKKVCGQTFHVTKYPRFIYFQDGQRDRMYPVDCPRYTEFFYNWILGKGDENYCSGSLTMAMAAAGKACISRVSNSLIIVFVAVFAICCGIAINKGMIFDTL